MNRIFNSRLAALALAGLAAAASSAAFAQTGPSAAPAADPNAVVDAARALLRAHYVLPDTAGALDKALADAEAAGKFAGLSGPALSQAINAVMRTVTPDGHLSTQYNPQRSAQLAADANRPERDDEVASPEQARQMAQANGGVAKLEVLPGNVRYMDYRGFMWGAPVAGAALTNAAEFLRGGAAVIIDLRRNGGGSSEAVADFVSWFLPARTPLMQFRTRDGAEETSQTHAKPFSLADRPVYVLTSKRTFSAAEEFSAHVAAFGFAKLVGETTGGGGFNNTFYPLPGGLAISISTGQAVQLKTGKGWERVGIAPALAVPADRALDTAQAEALAALAVRASPSDKPAVERLASYYRARADHVAPSRPLADYVGNYGPFRVTLGGDGVLSATAPTGPSALVALGGDSFAPEFDPAIRANFVVEGGQVTAVELLTPGGTQRFARG
jgi:hypothetical protein